MAAYVENRRHCLTTFQPGPNLRSEFTRPPDQQHAPVVFDDSDSSSTEDDESIIEFEDTIKKGKLELEPSVWDSRDKGTADHWVHRNPSLIRLTGKHPFNSEPSLSRLMSHGFITPAPLHYVRNHGPVPMATWDDWTVEVTGLVKKPTGSQWPS